MTEHRTEIMARCHAKAAARTVQPTTDLLRGIPLFLDQLVQILHTKQHGGFALIKAATIHGAELLRRGLTVGQVVHDYGDICQTITGLAIERNQPISTDEFQLLNRCLDDAIASAVTEYGRQRELDVAADVRDRSTDDLGILSFEVGNLVWSAGLAFDALKTGSVGVSGSTGAVVSRSLASLRSLVERSFAAMTLKGRGGTPQPISIGNLVAAVKQSVTGAAIARGVPLTFEIHHPDAIVEADLRILAPIVAQLVLNACDHTPTEGQVVLRSSADTAWARIEIEDKCGGLPLGVSAKLFATDGNVRSGLGLSLGLIRHGIEAIGGTIEVRDLPGQGCRFTLELPRQSSTS